MDLLELPPVAAALQHYIAAFSVGQHLTPPTLIPETGHEPLAQALAVAVLEGLHRLRERGIRLFLSTGRHKVMSQSVRDLFPFDGCITLSGQYCFAQDRVLRSVPFAPERVKALVELMEHSTIPCIFLEEEDCYLVNPGPRKTSVSSRDSWIFFLI